MASQPWNSVMYEDDTEIAIIGGGVCGTLLAGRCAEQNINFTIVDRQATLGGVWLEYANQHSSLQVGCRDQWLLSRRIKPCGAHPTHATVFKAIIEISDACSAPRSCTDGTKHILWGRGPLIG